MAALRRMRKHCAGSKETHLLIARMEPRVGPSRLCCQRQQRISGSVGYVPMHRFALPKQRLFCLFPKRRSARRQKILHTVELVLVRGLIGQRVARGSCYEFSIQSNRSLNRERLLKRVTAPVARRSPMSAFGGKTDMTVCGCPLSRSLLGVKRTSLVS